MTVLPAQFFARPAVHAPERRLLQGVLERAILDWQQPRPSGHWSRGSGDWIGAFRQELLDWFQSDALTVYSFRYCCEHLALDPGAVRQAILGPTPT